MGPVISEDAGGGAGLEGKPEGVARPVKRESGRIGAVDALRGVAALAVVLYHYTQRYGELAEHGKTDAAFAGQYPSTGTVWFHVPWGHFGVQLFFMISGFVILMTVMKVRSVGEFAVLRLARLYPAYWVACGLTFGIVL